MTRERTKLWYLRNHDLFSQMHKDDLKMVDQHSRMREIKRGGALYLEGTPDTSFYLLKKGVVKVARILPQGKEIILDIFSGGTVFGELSGEDHQERDESAVALEDCLVCIFSKQDFELIIGMMPGLSVRMDQRIDQKRRRVEAKLIDLLYRTVEQRIAKALLTLLEDFSVPHVNGLLLNLRLTHKDIADLVASTRETVTMTLNKLKGDGLIDFQDKQIVVISLDKIKTLAET